MDAKKLRRAELDRLFAAAHAAPAHSEERRRARQAVIDALLACPGLHPLRRAGLAGKVATP